MLSWVREKIAESRLRWQQHSYQTEDRNSVSPPPLPPPDFDESPVSSGPTMTDITELTTTINGTQSPSPPQTTRAIITTQAPINLTLPLKFDSRTNAAQHNKCERFEPIQQPWSFGNEQSPAQCLEKRFVKESNVRHVTLRVFNSDGSKCTVNTPVTLTGADVKKRALAEFRSTYPLPASIQKVIAINGLTDYDNRSNYNNRDIEKLSKMYKITRINHMHERFDENLPLIIANIQNYEEFLLIICADSCLLANEADSSNHIQLKARVTGNARPDDNQCSVDQCDDFVSDCLQNNDQSTNRTILPTHTEIELATQSLAATEPTATNNVINIFEFVLHNDVQHDIRRLLVSLANSCAHVIGAGPYSDRVIHMLKQRLLRQKRFEYDTQQYLIDMGFAQRNVQHALHMCNNICAAALEWLIENPSPTDFVEVNDGSTDVSTPSKCASNTITTDNIEPLLEIIRVYGQRESPPSPDIVQLFVDMGFDEALAREALRVTGNRHSLACEWLVGNRSKVEYDRTENSPFNTHILNTLLDSPHIQLGLSSPKIFFAFLSILEDYAAMGMWLNDNETANIIGEILQTYHGEKHISAINQMRD